jgi:hypothetical protein
VRPIVRMDNTMHLLIANLLELEPAAAVVLSADRVGVLFRILQHVEYTIGAMMQNCPG